METHSAAREQDAIRQIKMMLAGADRTAMKWRDDRTPIMVIGGDIEDDSGRKHRQREFLESAAPHRERQGPGHPPKPPPLGERRVARQQRVVQRECGAATKHQRGTDRQIAGRHGPLIYAGRTLPAEHQHQHDREADRDQRRGAREKARHQAQSGDQLGCAEQNQRGIEEIEMMQQKADDMVGS